MTRLGKAIALAAQGHEEQTDKAGTAYILHPLHLMRKVTHKGESAMIVAVLHDYFEDCESHAACSDLSFLTPAERYALDCLTHRKGEDYLTTYMERILTSDLAMDAKEQDLIHNLDGSRMPNRPLTPKDLKRWDKYRLALDMIRQTRAFHS